MGEELIWITGAHHICVLFPPKREMNLRYVSALYLYKGKKGAPFFFLDGMNVHWDCYVICTQCSCSHQQKLTSCTIHLIFFPAAARKVQKGHVQELMLILPMFACWKTCSFVLPCIFLRHLVCSSYLTKMCFHSDSISKTFNYSTRMNNQVDV